MLNRREFSKTLLKGQLLPAYALWRGIAPNDLYAQQARESIDLLITGGTVVDPGQELHGRMDVAVKDGKIFEIGRDLPREPALRIFSAEGAIVVPGLIDVHVHCFDGVGVCINADRYCLPRGVTTVLDAGSSGHTTIANFRKYVMASSATRIRALLNISQLAQVVGADKAWERKDWLNPVLTGESAKMNKPDVVGIKVQLGQEQGPQDIDILRRALEAAEIAQVPLMAHIDGTFSPLPKILGMLRKGDVYSHFLNSHAHGILDEKGKLLPVAGEARERGVFFDVAQGSTHLSFEVAKRCLAQGFEPDTISTDLNQGGVTSRVHDLPTMVGKFLALGLTLDKGIQMVTANPIQIFNFGAQIGTLRPGSAADISVFEVREGSFDFEDSEGATIKGSRQLVPKAVVRDGKFVQEAA